MSERILKALMQLFAIIAKVDGVNSSSRAIVQSFLKQLLNQELVEYYLKVFDDFIEAHHQVSKRKDGSAKRTSLNSVKVLKICTQINSELTQKQKIVVLARLIEFIHSSNQISDQEHEFVATVAETFNVDETEFKQCLNFIESSADEVLDESQLLIINNNPVDIFQNAKHLYSENVSGQIKILSIQSVNIYLMIYSGNIDLYLNGQIINEGKVYVLTEGSSIRSSKVAPIYYSDIISKFLSDESTSKISFEAKKLEYKFKSGKIGLRDVNIREESGKLIGIMGGSGAGKSTLLNVLNGVESPSAGEVLINGINIHTQKALIEGVIGHVSQDDLLIEELTVFQNLFYNAKLCFGNKSDVEISGMVLDVLTNIGLYETRDLKVGSPLEKTISGGQRKRLNIALELIREPSVMFVDEPTSGLSSRDSENIMDLLKELALKGKLIFVVIHQPSSEIFKMFDKLIILDVGGYPIYYGNPVDAIIYFKRLVNHASSDTSECQECGNVNPEQIFNIIESKVLDEYGNLTQNRKVSPSEWNGYYKEQIESKLDTIKHEGEIPESTFKIPGKIKQLLVFLTRDVKSKLTNTQYMVINLIEAPLLAFILAYLTKFYSTDVANKTGYIFRENSNLTAYLFMSVVVALFIGLTVSAEEIIRDRKIQKRESFLNLSRLSYLGSKIKIMFVLSAVQTFTFSLLGNWIMGIDNMLSDYWLVLFTTSCFANMLGLNISAAFNSAVTIYILIPFLLIPQLLLSGVIVKFEKLNPSLTSQKHVPLAGDMMTSRWAFEALAVNQFKENEYEKNFYDLDKKISYTDFKKNFWLPKLRAKADNCDNLLAANKKNTADFSSDLSVLKNEIIKENNRIKKVKFKKVDMLSDDKVSQAVITEVKSYLTELNNYYIKIFNENSDKKDKIVGSMIKELGNDNFLNLKNACQNENLSDLVTNKNELDRIIEKDGELIQRADPVYLDPESNFNSHFYAPRKKLFGRYYDTFWFNISVIWIMSLTLFFTLYYDVFRKILEAAGEISERFSKRK